MLSTPHSSQPTCFLTCKNIPPCLLQNRWLVVAAIGSNTTGGTTLAVHDSQLIDTFLWSALASSGTEKGVNDPSPVLISLISQTIPSILTIQIT